jgi:hypothetical protein
MKKERGHPKAAPIPGTRHLTVPSGWDNPAALHDDELMLVVRSMLAVDRAVNGYRGRRWAA